MDVENPLYFELPRFGVEVTFVEFDDPAKVEAAIRPNTKVVYTETISNPLMDRRLQVLPHHRHQVVECVFYVTRREGRVGCYFFRKLCGIHVSRTYNSGIEEIFTAFFVFQSWLAVSYTHLDVYKRQIQYYFHQQS